MKTHFYLLVVMPLLALNVGSIRAQTLGYCDPDSLEPITISGRAMVITDGAHPQYRLDIDNDDSADYVLNFGPFWYEPDEGNAERPADDAPITIYGGLNETNPGVIPVIIVYTINDLYWRNPFEPYWNNLNGNYSGAASQQGSGYNCGWFDSTLIWMEAEGNVMLDTTFKYIHYLLDTNMDELPDLRLNFGPYWYEPETGIVLPEHGDYVVVSGVFIALPSLDMIVVSTLNGDVWRDSFLLNQNMAGQWIETNMLQARHMFSPFDSYSRIRVRENWNTGILPDSIYCQLMEVMPQNMSQYTEENAIAAFEIGAFNVDKHNLMLQHQWRIQFNEPIDYQFRYHAQQLALHQITQEEELELRLMYWKAGNSWVEQEEIVIDPVSNLITFSTDELRGLYLLTFDRSTGVSKLKNNEAGIAALVYPNPFTAGFTVNLSRIEDTGATVVLYDLQGKRLAEKYVQQGSPGFIETGRLEAGIYILEILVDGRCIDRQKLIHIDG